MTVNIGFCECWDVSCVGSLRFYVVCKQQNVVVFAVVNYVDIIRSLSLLDRALS